MMAALEDGRMLPARSTSGCFVLLAEAPNWCGHCGWPLYIGVLPLRVCYPCRSAWGPVHVRVGRRWLEVWW